MTGMVLNFFTNKISFILKNHLSFYRSSLILPSSILLEHPKTHFSSLAQSTVKLNIHGSGIVKATNKSLLAVKPPLLDSVRALVKFSWKKGTRMTNHTVVKKFFRLNWGMWIRTKAGRNKRLWSKSASRRNRISQHVFCSQEQCLKLDTLVSKYWRKPKYYIEDPYEPYHSRENFYLTRRKPWRPEGCDYE